MIWIKNHSPKIGLQHLLGYLLVLRVTRILLDTNDTQIMFFYNFITRFDFHFLPKVRHHQCASRNLEVWLTKCILTPSGFCASFLGESPKRKEVAMYAIIFRKENIHEVMVNKSDGGHIATLRGTIHSIREHPDIADVDNTMIMVDNNHIWVKEYKEVE